MKPLSKRYRSQNAPSTPQEKITKEFVVQLLAAALPTRGGNRRAVKQQIRTRIDKAIKDGELEQATFRNKPALVCGRFAAWAQDNLPHLFDQVAIDLPVMRDNEAVVTGLQVAGLIGRSAPTSIPNTLKACQELLAEAQQTIAALDHTLRDRAKPG